MGSIVSADNKFRTKEVKQKRVEDNPIERVSTICKGVEENTIEKASIICKKAEKKNPIERVYKEVEENPIEKFSKIHKEVYDLANSNEPISEKIKHALNVIEESLTKYGYD